MNLFFSGADSDSIFVVAPINVNLLIGKRILHHSGITKSITRSSIAIYNTSSIVGFRRCISSINKISHSCKLLRIEISSDGLEIAYHVTALIFTHISLAMMWASVVFPYPLFPEKSICPNV
jgi:hypothetical protein